MYTVVGGARPSAGSNSTARDPEAEDARFRWLSGWPWPCGVACFIGLPSPEMASPYHSQAWKCATKGPLSREWDWTAPLRNE